MVGSVVLVDSGTDALLHGRWPKGVYVPGPVMALASKTMPLVARLQRRRKRAGGVSAAGRTAAAREASSR